MFKTLVAASVLTLGLGGSALAQSTITGAPAGQIPETQEPPARTSMPRHHFHHVYRHHYYHVARHAMHRKAPPGTATTTPAGAAPQGGTPTQP